MTWTDFDERYGESKEDHTAVEEDDRESCSICGLLYPPDELTRRTFQFRNVKRHEAVCPDCLEEERRCNDC